MDYDMMMCFHNTKYVIIKIKNEFEGSVFALEILFCLCIANF